jgi:hypothetical protein
MSEQEFDINRELRQFWQKFADAGIYMESISFEIAPAYNPESKDFVDTSGYALWEVGMNCKLSESLK